MLNFISNFYYFLNKGILIKNDPKFDFKFFLSIFLFKIIFLLIIGFIQFFFINYNLDMKNKVFLDESYLKIFLNLVIIAPILEEFIFRYHLKLDVKRVFVSFLFSCFLFYDNLFFLLLMTIYFAFLIYNIRKNNNINVLVFVYLSSVLFAVGHFYSYSETVSVDNFYQFVLLFISHFIGALILGYIFKRNGLLFSILFHSAFNFFPFMILALKDFILMN